jgi:hypothetical protein
MSQTPEHFCFAKPVQPSKIQQAQRKKQAKKKKKKKKKKFSGQINPHSLPHRQQQQQTTPPTFFSFFTLGSLVI